ncbi:aminotransferase class V [Leadbetterella byssophila DSM 17132]|uniref:Aminotransferase class V n=1 Tax=Leadbetterella byssophila (strain DSM 17132 / JCM 16389 / KACC 11308 / NBRC 106382 / 4M15) TaxID=649349 RepID=E4RUG8_LEAB4|nr:aminotransferase class V-fold PLP-dependent enzyme [Leadbetterella byssophila]ADQ17859.1 aminotransferase class V [Leadbetterella byssophila DSM 17132]
MIRRNFLELLGGAGLYTTLKPLMPEYLEKVSLPGTDEDYWAQIQQAYTTSPQIINLNNGGVSPSPQIVQDAVERYNKYVNEAPSYYMWRILDQGREPLRENLAKYAGCSPEEIAFNRNATEALDTVILGLPLKAGDEVVLNPYDYPNMLHAWRQREMRDGIKLKFVKFPIGTEDETKIVQAYQEQMGPQTRVVHITHVINWNGQILPTKKIADAAHKIGAEVLIDGAHSFAHLDYKIPDLGGDYFGTSLHKWLSAPIGTGMLWIKKEKISKIYPLVPNDSPKSDNIRKFENLGTRPFPLEQAIGIALRFQEAIGNVRKENRLRFLKNYWAEDAAKMPKIKINTPFNNSCALAHVSVEGKTGGEIESYLFNKFKIHTSPIQWEDLNGVRVTPHVYTTLKDLDRLKEALYQLSKA